MSSTMKRTRQEFEAFNDGLASVANYLMLLSQTSSIPPPTHNYSKNGPHHDRIFECKTCNRQFPSFQALGGHRASHKKPKLSGPAQNGAHSSSENSSISNDNSYSGSSPPTKAKKTHECSICGAEFALGQALGGHMRRHKAAIFVEGFPSTTLSLSLLASCRPVKEVKKAAEKMVVMSGGGGGSTLCLDLSL